MAETTYSNLIVQALEDQQAAVDALAAARTAIAEAITAKGVSTPSTTKFNAMAAKINSIFQGRYAESGEVTFTAPYNSFVVRLPITFIPTAMVLFSTDTNFYSPSAHTYWYQDNINGGRRAYLSSGSNSALGEVDFITPTISSGVATFTGAGWGSSVTVSINAGTYYLIAIK